MPPYKGFVDVENKTFNWQTSFDDKIKFHCIGCGLSCIGTEVFLSENEIEKIKQISDKDFSEEIKTIYGSTKKRLKKINNRCIFLDENLRCSIHEHKPLLCREFPFKVLFTAPNQAVIDMTHSCGSIARNDFTDGNKIDFGELVKDHYINAKEDADDLDEFSRIVKYAKSNLDSHAAVEKCWKLIIDKLVSPIELCALIENFQKSREEFKSLSFSNADKYIECSLSMDFPEIVWEDFMEKFLKRITSEKNNFVGLEPISLRKYSIILKESEIDFVYYFSGEKKLIRLSQIKRRIILPDGIETLKDFLGKFWDRAVTSSDFYLAMMSFRERFGKFPPSIIVQLDALRFALHSFEFFLHVIAEKNSHEDITDDYVKEAIVLLDGAFLTVTSSVVPE